jgi:YidC/Oxa1 family membrane protein insertase
MTQTRTFLIFAWLAVATLLFMAWTQEKSASSQSPVAAAQTAPAVHADGAVPSIATGDVPQAPKAAPVMSATPAAAASDNAAVVTVTTDVLRVELDGGSMRQADLLAYPQTTAPGADPIRLFASDPQHFYQAQSGWVSNSGAAPTHEAGFRPVDDKRAYHLAPGQDSVVVPFEWSGPDGVTIRRTYTFDRGDYAVRVRDTVANAGSKPWQGYVYRQLVRVPPQVKSGFTHPESYSFHGATWFSPEDKFERRPFKDFGDGPLDPEHPLGKEVTGGWIAMLQHHFFTAWIPEATVHSTFSLASPAGSDGTTTPLVRELGSAVSVAPGAHAETSARLWVGPKLVKAIEGQHVPGLERAVDFSRFASLAWIAELLFAVLSFLQGIFGNWGWAIIGLVLLVKLLMFPLSAAQYKSAAKMRRFQPRIEQLKERYGDDKQKLQMAMMELYKKEKINPVGGCLPVLLQMPVFLALYYTLLESVELRQAPWIGWIHNLTAPDPYFILPVINIAVMFVTQKLTPTPIADPMQRKMMQFMPLAMGVMFAFFPAGLVLYWVTNGGLGLLQQWYMLRKYGDKPGNGMAGGKTVQAG